MDETTARRIAAAIRAALTELHFSTYDDQGSVSADVFLEGVGDAEAAAFAALTNY